MNQQDEDEIIMDTLAGESSLKKILEMLEDLSRRLSSIEAQMHYKPKWDTTTSPYTNTPNVWYSNNITTTNTGTATTAGYYTYYNSDGSETQYYVEQHDTKQA